MTGNVKSWKVVPFRSKLLSEYVGEPDWRAIAWHISLGKIEIEINRPVEVFATTEERQHRPSGVC